mmetsp:Transcript_25457/g.69983  ORF Transcript_25457/g.69983 Transcript_25457/m.69983 type:complete len:223 (+) Transcript_25457:337-1005(+)
MWTHTAGPGLVRLHRANSDQAQHAGPKRHGPRWDVRRHAYALDEQFYPRVGALRSLLQSASLQLGGGGHLGSPQDGPRPVARRGQGGQRHATVHHLEYEHLPEGDGVGMPRFEAHALLHQVEAPQVTERLPAALQHHAHESSKSGALEEVAGRQKRLTTADLQGSGPRHESVQERQSGCEIREGVVVCKEAPELLHRVGTRLGRQDVRRAAVVQGSVTCTSG